MLVESNTSSTMNNLFQEGFFLKHQEKQEAKRRAKVDEELKKQGEEKSIKRAEKERQDLLKNCPVNANRCYNNLEECLKAGRDMMSALDRGQQPPESKYVSGSLPEDAYKKAKSWLDNSDDSLKCTYNTFRGAVNAGSKDPANDKILHDMESKIARAEKDIQTYKKDMDAFYAKHRVKKESVDDFDDTAKKIDLITAYAYNEYCTLVESTNLDHESGKINDAEYASIMLEAQEEAGKKMQKSVKAAIANTKNYFSKTSNSVDKVVKGDKYQSIITNAKDLCKKNPAVAKLEVEYDDYTEESDAISKAWTKVDKIIARGKAKKNLTEADGDELKSINEDINKLRGRKKPVKKTANLSAAISALEAVVKAIDDNADAQKGPDKAPIAEVSGWDVAAAKRMADAIAMSGRLNKEMSAVNVRTAMSLKSGIKSTIKKARHMKVDDDKDTTESVRIFSSFDENEYMEQVVSQFKNNTRDLNKGEEDDNMLVESKRSNESTGINSILKESADLDAEVDRLIQEACSNAGIDTRSEDEIEVDNLIAEAVREAEGYSNIYDDVVTEGLVTGILGGTAKAVGGAVKGVADTVTNADKEDATEETVDDEDEETEESSSNVDDIFSQIFTEAKSKKDDEECDDDECSDDAGEDKEKSGKKSKSKKDDDDDNEEDDKDDDEDSDDDSDDEEVPDESEEEECVEQTVDELIEEAARAAGIDTNGTDYMLRNFDEIFGL